MLRIHYEKVIPYPYAVVLGQYYDYEHIRFVHPTTLGEYRLIESGPDRICYEQIWPGREGRRARSLVEQRFFPPNGITFDFIEGRHRGIKVETLLHPRRAGQPSPPSESNETLVEESYMIPGLPDWSWLARIIRPFVLKAVDRVWEEDLSVGVCYGGWPDVPEAARNSWPEEPAD